MKLYRQEWLCQICGRVYARGTSPTPMGKRLIIKGVCVECRM